MRYVIAALVLLSAAAAFVIGCRKDVVVEPPPSLSGDYVGTYTYKKGSQVIERPIIWKFTTDQFLMDVDMSKLDSTEDREFCDCGGIYILTDGVEIRARSESDYNRKKQNCKEYAGPYARFSLDQSKENQVIMTSQGPDAGDTTTVFRTLTLQVAQ